MTVAYSKLDYQAALTGNDRLTDEQVAALPENARRILLAHRAKESKYVAKTTAVLAKTLATRTNEARILNRESSLREYNGLFATDCACGWHSLRVSDPEVARRELDGHVCAINGSANVERAVNETDKSTLEKREGRTVMVDAFKDETLTQHVAVEAENESLAALLELR